MRRLCVFVVLLSAPLWMPWVFAASVGEVAPPVAAALPPVVALRVHASVVAARPRPPRFVTSPTPRIATSFAEVRLPLRPPVSHPAVAADFPDPDIIHVGVTWWAYATGTGFEHLQMRSSPDLLTWSAPTDPLPHLPAWAAPGYHSWAPAVEPADGAYLLYYSARDVAYGRQCIGVASSAAPGGPFVDTSVAPLTCQTGVGGSIDPAPFTDADGTRYLTWKSEENALGLASEIGSQQLAPDGLSLTGPRPRLLTASSAWQAGVAEGPTMVPRAGRYYLFYGAGHWDTAGAGIGYAVCSTPLGPCVDQARARPWLGSFAGAYGPSGPDVFTGPDGRDWIAFHAWNTDPGLGESGRLARRLWIEPVTIVNGVPVIG